jgi:hypothetical protein
MKKQLHWHAVEGATPDQLKKQEPSILRMYGDIIDYDYQGSKKRPRMPADKRAAQFLPFAALTGFDAAIKETARETDVFHEPGEDEQENLNKALAYLLKIADQHPQVTIRRFVQDGRKPGGKYEEVAFVLKRVEKDAGYLVSMERQRYALGDVVEIRCEGMDGVLY